MKYIPITFFLLFCHTKHNGQQISAEQLLDKAIAYHDPNGVWSTFNGSLRITMTSPQAVERISDINMDLPSHYFKLSVKQDGNLVEYIVQRDSCVLMRNGNPDFSEEDSETYALTCDRAKMMRNYYTY